MQAINAALLDTIAACGDVNRNVMRQPQPVPVEGARRGATSWRATSASTCCRRRGAYHEIWLDGEKVDGQSEPAKQDEEPIYGTHYLPRKFKIVIAVPPSNDVDIFAHDLGFIAIVDEAASVVGWNVTVGGGMGMTHGEPDTFPRTADVIGFCTPEQAVDVAEKVVTVQRDWGNREQPQARAPEIHDRGSRPRRLPRRGREARSATSSASRARSRSPRPATASAGRRAPTSKWHLTLFVENGRIKDMPGWTLRTALREIAELHAASFVVTANQNVIIANVPAEGEGEDRGDPARRTASPSARAVGPAPQLAWPASRCRPAGWRWPRASASCPSCSRRSRSRSTRRACANDDIVIRMTGCPNGCARPYLAEIGLVGRRPGPLQPLSRRRLRRLAAQQALRRGRRQGAHRRAARADVRALRQGARGGRALRRLRHPRRLRAGRRRPATASTPTSSS